MGFFNRAFQANRTAQGRLHTPYTCVIVNREKERERERERKDGSELPRGEEFSGGVLFFLHFYGTA